MMPVTFSNLLAPATEVQRPAAAGVVPPREFPGGGARRGGTEVFPTIYKRAYYVVSFDGMQSPSSNTNRAVPGRKRLKGSYA